MRSLQDYVMGPRKRWVLTWLHETEREMATAETEAEIIEGARGTYRSCGSDQRRQMDRIS